MQKTTSSTLHVNHEATQTELEKYRLLIESVQDYSIFLLDPDGYVQTWNKGAEKNKGYRPEEIIGKHFSTFYLEHDKKAKKPERELELAKRFGRVEDEDWRVRKDGTRFWANVVITALFDQTGQLVGFGKVTRDLTERKQHEDALRRANVLLRQQQKELGRLNASKDEFISLASHQLRTPATSIKQYLGLVLEGFLGEPEPQILAALKKAYESNERQLNIVTSLLKVAQIDAGKVIIKAEPTDVEKMLHDIVESCADSFKHRAQQISIEVEHPIPYVMVDGRYFRMALENIVDNASKYTQKNGTIGVTARHVEDELHISIADTGVGIAEKDLGRLFEKFDRIPNALSDAVGGSGLGLYWVQQVIALHKGHITVSSEQDKGTTFTVCVPVLKEGMSDA